MKKITIRKKITLILFGLFLCTVLLEAGLRIGGFIVLSLQEYKNKLSLKKDGYRILCLGESTTQDGYPEQLNLILNDMDPRKEFSVINKGIGGTNTGIILTRLESYLEKYKPDIVITMMGINDKYFSALDPVEDIFKERKNERIYDVNALRIYKLFKLSKLHINEKLKEIMHEKREIFSESVIREEVDIEGRIDRDASHEPEYLQQGKNYNDQRRFDKAEEILRKGIELDPRNARIYIELGLCYNEQGRYDEAEDILRKGIELDPKNARGYVELGCCYNDQKRYEETEEILKKGIEVDPKNAHAHLILGWCYREQRRYEEAEEMFKKVIEFDSQKAYGYTELGWCYNEQGRYDESGEILKKGIELDPEYETTRHYLLVCLQQDRKKGFNIEDKGSGYYLPSTVINYQKSRDLIMEKGIALVCVEYAMRDVGELKSIIGEHKNVYFVDNEKSFKEAVEREGYGTYFTDRYGEEFGHMTIKGKRLLSKNIADVIFKEYFNK